MITVNTVDVTGQYKTILVSGTGWDECELIFHAREPYTGESVGYITQVGLASYLTCGDVAHLHRWDE